MLQAPWTPRLDESATRTPKGSYIHRPSVTVRHLAVLAALVLVVLPGAIAQPTPPTPSADCTVPEGEPAFDPDADVETWEGDLDGDLAGGRLEVRSFHSGAYVVPWNRSGWQVEIAEIDPLDKISPTVQAETDGGSFSLVAVVDRDTGPVQVQVGQVDEAYAQVKVRVPDWTYEEIVVADEPDGNGTTIGTGLTDTSRPDWSDLRVFGLDSGELRLRAGRVAANVAHGVHDRLVAGTDNHPLTVADVQADTLEVSTDNGAGCLTGARAGSLEASNDNGATTVHDVQADTAHIQADNGGLEVHHLQADQADIESDNGNTEVRDVQVTDLATRSDNGDVTLQRVNGSRLDVQVDNSLVRIQTARFDEATFTGDNQDLVARGLEVADFTYTSDNGDIDADLFPTGSGTWNLSSDNGQVDLHLPVGDRYGYDARATVDNGEPVLEIPGTEVVSRTDSSVHVRTTGYEDRPVRTRIEIQGDNAQVRADDELQSTAGAFASVSTEAAASAGILAAITAALVLLWPKLKVVLHPLYTRISRDEILDNATRRRIVEAVRAEPGIHFRGLKRRLDVGRGILQHHLDKLVQAGYLAEHGAEAYRCYFAQGQVDRRVMEVADRLRADGARAVLDAVRHRPGSSLTEVAEAADVSASTAGYHLDKLAEAGLVHKARNGPSLAVDLTDLGSRAVDELRLT